MANVVLHPAFRFHRPARSYDASRRTASVSAAILAGVVALVMTVGMADTFVVSSASTPMSSYDVSTVG